MADAGQSLVRGSRRPGQTSIARTSARECACTTVIEKCCAEKSRSNDGPGREARADRRSDKGEDAREIVQEEDLSRNSVIARPLVSQRYSRSLFGGGFFPSSLWQDRVLRLASAREAPSTAAMTGGGAFAGTPWIVVHGAGGTHRRPTAANVTKRDVYAITAPATVPTLSDAVLLSAARPGRDRRGSRSPRDPNLEPPMPTILRTNDAVCVCMPSIRA